MSIKKSWLIGLTLVVVVGVAVFLGRKFALSETPTVLEPAEQPAGMAKATFRAGCFWCTEAVFSQLKGVRSVVSGYSGGWLKNPTYREVCTGTTGHAEAIQVTYDPTEISY